MSSLYKFTTSSLEFRNPFHGLLILTGSLMGLLVITFFFYLSYPKMTGSSLPNLYLVVILITAMTFGRNAGMAFASGAAVLLMGGVLFRFTASDYALLVMWSFLKSAVFLGSGWFVGETFRSFEEQVHSENLMIEKLEETANNIRAEIESRENRKAYLIRRREQLEELTRSIRRLSVAMSLKEVSAFGLTTMREVVKRGRALLYLREDDHYKLAGADPDAPRYVEPDDLDMKAIQTSRSLLVRDVAKEFRVDARRVRRHCPTGSVVVAPIHSAGKVIGFLRMENPQPESYTPDEQRLLSILSDILGAAIANARLYERTQQLAQIDGLTGLYQRWVFNERLKEEIDRASRYGYPFGLFMLDIDHFKSINDNYGHTVGDMVLRSVADETRALIREGDFPARYGGEEFVLILTRAEPPQLKEIAERLRARVENNLRVPPPEGEGRATVSIGIASFPLHGKKPEELIERADQALYRVKENGRNNIRLYGEGAADREA